jgi:hypothetical protein
LQFVAPGGLVLVVTAARQQLCVAVDQLRGLGLSRLRCSPWPCVYQQVGQPLSVCNETLRPLWQMPAVEPHFAAEHHQSGLSGSSILARRAGCTCSAVSSAAPKRRLDFGHLAPAHASVLCFAQQQADSIDNNHCPPPFRRSGC